MGGPPTTPIFLANRPCPMKCTTPKMKQICKSGRTVSIPGHRQERLRYLGMGVEPMVATHMVVIARKMAPMTAMGMTLGHMALAVQRAKGRAEDSSREEMPQFMLVMACMMMLPLPYGLGAALQK